MLEQSKLKLFLLFIVMMFIGLISYNHYRTETPPQQEVEVAVEKIIKPINAEHLKCMAENIYFEAGAEPFIGQVAVARVVVNRIAHGFGSNPCKVIYQSTKVVDPEDSSLTKKICQFSWVCEGKTLTNRMSAKYLQAEDIARQVLSENKWAELIPGNVLFFHNTSVSPNWAYRKITTIGNHVFYSKDRVKKPVKE